MASGNLFSLKKIWYGSDKSTLTPFPRDWREGHREGDEAPDPRLDGEGTPRGEDDEGLGEENPGDDQTGFAGFSGGAYDTTSSDPVDPGGCSSSASMFANPAQ